MEKRLFAKASSRILVLVIVTGLQSMTAYCQEAVSSISSEIGQLRDSLDAIQYTVSKPICVKKWKVVNVCTQDEWDNILINLKALLDHGHNNLEIRVTGKNIIYGEKDVTVLGWNYPKANLRFVGKKSILKPFGYNFTRNAGSITEDGSFYAYPYSDYNLTDIAVDSNGDEIPFREEVTLVNGDILKVHDSIDVWKFQIDLPDLSEVQCKDFYVLMTRDWTSARHKVVKVKDGWLYYHLDSEDLHSDRDPNVDWIQYKIRPRYCLINNPLSRGLHCSNGKLYIPRNVNMIRIGKKGKLLTFAHCRFNSLEITGFNLNGCGDGSPIGIYYSQFDIGCYIHDNEFKNISSVAIYTAYNKNVSISDNTVYNTRVSAISGGGENTCIHHNYLKKTGWMLNTQAIMGGGENLHICDNIIENFNYAAIACGSSSPNDKVSKLTYIIERNTIRQTEAFTDNYIQNTLADGGGIYIGPQCTQGIIRNNVIENIKGIHSNRGIFLDDGAKNLAIYGNLIMNTANSYDIDLRYSAGYAAGIPDHNTNNCIFQNIMTGGYRFEDAGEGSNCIGGENVLLGTGMAQKTVVELKRRAADRKVQGSKELRVQGVLESIPLDVFVKKQMRNKN